MPGSAQLAGSVDAGAELRAEILHFSSSSHPGDSNVHSSAEQSHVALLGIPTRGTLAQEKDSG